MNIGKDLLMLSPKADQRVNVEKSAIPKVLRGRAPERQTIVLPFQQIVQCLVVPVNFFDGAVNGSGCDQDPPGESG